MSVFPWHRWYLVFVFAQLIQNLDSQSEVVLPAVSDATLHTRRKSSAFSGLLWHDLARSRKKRALCNLLLYSHPLIFQLLFVSQFLLVLLDPPG